MNIINYIAQNDNHTYGIFFHFVEMCCIMGYNYYFIHTKESINMSKKVTQPKNISETTRKLENSKETNAGTSQHPNLAQIATPKPSKK